MQRLRHDVRAMGRQLAHAGIRLDRVVVDLDETLWDWCYPMLRQRRPLTAHMEWVYVREPLLWLLEGLGEGSAGPLKAWTAGYGYRVDRICEQTPLLADLLRHDPGRGDEAERSATIVTRRDFARGVAQAPHLIPYRGRWVSQKIPGLPTAAGKPAVDAARILLDDKETNCRRFVGAGDGRSAIWLRGAPRVWANNLRLMRPWTPPTREWASGVAHALSRIADGRPGLYTVDPAPAEVSHRPVAVSLPHRTVWREWIHPSRTLARHLNARPAT